MKKIRIGTRGSKLALIQTEMVIKRFKKFFPNYEYETIVIKTDGDITQKLNTPIKEKGSFVKKIEEALIKDDIDIAVHSMKDMSVFESELKTVAVLEREKVNDVLISQTNVEAVSVLKNGGRIGTGSERRKRFLKYFYPTVEIMSIRGNVETRIQKVEKGEYDAVILAYAGVKRVGLLEKISFILPEKKFLPAPLQGIIAIQTKKDNEEIIKLCERINHLSTFEVAGLERKAVSIFGGDCSFPLGIYSEKKGNEYYMKVGFFYEEKIFLSEFSGDKNEILRNLFKYKKRVMG